MNTCPQCATEMEWQPIGHYCQTCRHYWQSRAHCPDCDGQLEKLQACGSVSYFCPDCQALKSRSAVKKVWRRVNPCSCA